jgi:hypothetical protein
LLLFQLQFMSQRCASLKFPKRLKKNVEQRPQ